MKSCDIVLNFLSTGYLKLQYEVRCLHTKNVAAISNAVILTWLTLTLEYREAGMSPYLPAVYRYL